MTFLGFVNKQKIPFLRFRAFTRIFIYFYFSMNKENKYNFQRDARVEVDFFDLLECVLAKSETNPVAKFSTLYVKQHCNTKQGRKSCT